MKPLFNGTGIGLFAAIYVNQRCRRPTCAITTRAIYLEVVEDLDTDSFINSLQRFMNRRGRLDELFSDCGFNFKRTAQELKIEARKVKKILADKGTTWNSNPPASPHMGGVWERRIKTVKDVLYSMIKSKVLTEFQLCTIFTEIEVIVSNLPLTHVSDSPDDFEALNPNHFLLGRFNTVGGCCWWWIYSEKWKQVVAITKQFWKRWLSEYLSTLQQRNKWKTNQANIKNRALVIVKEDNLPRGKWSLGRITDVLPSEDSIVRVVRVKTAEREYLVPIVKIILLESSLQWWDSSRRGGVMNSDFNMTYTCRAVHGNHNIKYF